MGEEKTNINYTAEDIRNYLSGKLPPAAMHAMEKAALDDPLLAEALEGYDIMKNEDTSIQLAMLRNHFSQEKEAKVVPLNPSRAFSMWKVAAAVIVICGGLAITYMFTKNDGSGERTLAKIESADTGITSLAQTGNNDSINSSLATQSSPAEENKKEALVLENEEGNVLQDTAFMYRPPRPQNKNERGLAGGGYIADAQAKANDLSASNNASPSTLNNASKIEQANRNQVSEPESLNMTAQAYNAPSRKFTAQVLSPDNKPLPFANIKIPADNVGTYADVKGNFKLISSDSLINIEVKSTGFLTRNYTLRNNNLNEKIVLSRDDVSLKGKTIVSGNASAVSRKRSTVLQADTLMDAEPADGWFNYDTYITNNLAPPKEVLQQKIHGEVEVSFEVLNNGVISNVKVDRSLCNDCDEEVLRLLKEGPKWKVTKGKKASAKLRVKF